LSVPTDTARLRRVVRLVCAIVFVDTVFFAVIAPLLPSLAHELHLSKLSAGILTGAVAAGTLLGSIPGGVFAARAGSRPAMLVGLTMLGGATVVFGLANNIVLLDVARFVQGFGGAYTWSGSFEWLIAEAPVERRGSYIGLTVAAAGAGALVGPLVGTVAHALGRDVVFTVLAAVPFGLALVVSRYKSSSGTPVVDTASVAATFTFRPMIAAMWLLLLVGGAQALLTVLAPLRMAAVGGAAAAIGAAFLASAGLESLASILGGRVLDRRGPLLPLEVGLISGVVLLPCVVAAGTPFVLGAVITLLGVAAGLMWAPAIGTMSDEAEHRGISQGVSFAMVNLSWAVGQMVGAWGGGAIAQAAGDTVAFACVAALWALTAAAVAIRPLPARPA
jgi:MFS family permease